MNCFFIDSNGYCVVDKARNDSVIHGHTLIMERLIGRPLKPKEVVHHKNEKRWNNCPFNLEIITRSTHLSLHRHDWVTRRGWACKKHPKTPENIIIQRSGTTCRICSNEYKKRWRKQRKLEGRYAN